jgi:hypothetical protein
MRLDVNPLFKYRRKYHDVKCAWFSPVHLQKGRVSALIQATTASFRSLSNSLSFNRLIIQSYRQSDMLT